MVLLKEFRVVLPMSVEEYRVGQLYSVAKTSVQQTGGGEGVEVIKNEPYSQDGQEGQYTEKKYYLGNKVPLGSMIPAEYMTLVEKAWNAYPYCKTVLSCPGFKDKFTFTIETRHFNDDGQQENIHGLTEEELKARQVEFIDITEKLDEKEYKASEDPTLVRSEKAGRGPLQKDWQKTSAPIMTCYKLVKVEINGMWFGGTIEGKIMSVEHNIFLKFHKQVFCWLDEWFGWTIEDVRRYEDQIKEELDAKRNAKDGGEGSSSKSKGWGLFSRGSKS
eukprot:TRINITY_DN2032_c0_g1_i1.p1 TRINITY_DN2032_c0_g1~~TRINITY_DN2032_c0_g1_i1.p1  ORF type:complete len:275 (+),score=27.78 TRINITY_DN2032_c0_g1_i1:205-1029(+)